MLTLKLDIFWGRVGLLPYMYMTSVISANLDIACCVYIHFFNRACVHFIVWILWFSIIYVLYIQWGK